MNPYTVTVYFLTLFDLLMCLCAHDINGLIIITSHTSMGVVLGSSGAKAGVPTKYLMEIIIDNWSNLANRMERSDFTSSDLASSLTSWVCTCSCWKRFLSFAKLCCTNSSVCKCVNCGFMVGAVTCLQFHILVLVCVCVCPVAVHHHLLQAIIHLMTGLTSAA